MALFKKYIHHISYSVTLEILIVKITSIVSTEYL